MMTAESPSRSGSQDHFRVLVPLDGSALAEQAIPYAAVLAGPGEEITFVQVAPPPEPIVDPVRGKLPLTDQDIARYEDRIRAGLATIARRWQAVVPRVKLEVAFGDPAEEIIRLAEHDRYDLIVMASHGRGALGRWTFGSVADRVVRSSTVPVMIVRPQDAPVEIGMAQIHRFIVPLDGSELANRVLPLVERLAQRLRHPVMLISVVPPTDELLGPAALAAFVSGDAVRRQREEIEARMRQAQEAAAARLEAAGIPTERRIVEGQPYAMIADAAQPGDVIVISTHGYSGIKRWVLGSVAEKLIRLAGAPVIMMRSPEAPSDH